MLFLQNSVGVLKMIEGSIDAKLCQTSIVNDIDIVANWLIFPEKNFVFQQDLAPTHIALSTCNYFKSKNIKYWIGQEIFRMLTQSKIYWLTLNMQYNKIHENPNVRCCKPSSYFHTRSPKFKKILGILKQFNFLYSYLFNS